MPARSATVRKLTSPSPTVAAMSLTAAAIWRRRSSWSTTLGIDTTSSSWYDRTMKVAAEQGEIGAVERSVPVLRVRDVGRSFGDVVALRGVDLEVDAGE